MRDGATRRGGPGGDRRGADLSGVDPELVRSALERAIEVARGGAARSPAVPAPKELTRYLEFRRLSGPALAAVLRVLDADVAFRERVVAETGPDDVDAAGWLALSRPEGWEGLLGEVAAWRQAAVDDEAAAQRLADLQKRLDVAVARQELTAGEADRARAELEAAREELGEARRAKRQAEETVESALGTIESQTERLAELEGRLDDTQGAREAREHELAAARGALAEAEAELARRPPVPAEGEQPVDGVRLRAAADALEAAVVALGAAVEGVRAEVPSPPVPPAGRPAAVRRRALTMPGGVVADTPEGARWLLGRPAVAVLVDGYNVAKRAWSGLSPAEERERLVRALDGLAMRTGASMDVVFDGPADADPGGGRSTRSVRVRFSGGATADDVVVDLVASFPADRPVVVVSNDRDVQHRSSAARANVVGSDAVIALF